MLRNIILGPGPTYIYIKMVNFPKFLCSIMNYILA